MQGKAAEVWEGEGKEAEGEMREGTEREKEREMKWGGTEGVGRGCWSEAADIICSPESPNPLNLSGAVTGKQEAATKTSAPHNHWSIGHSREDIETTCVSITTSG